MVVQCAPGVSLADLEAVELHGAGEPVWPEPVAGLGLEEGPLFEVAPQTWTGRIPDSAWATELYERAWALSEKYSSGTDAPAQVFAAAADTLEAPWRRVRLYFRDRRTLELTEGA